MALAVPEQPEFHFDALAEFVDLLARLPVWQARRRAGGWGPDDWFPTRGPGGAEALQRARQVCAGCPVTVECDTFGGGQAGMWGGRMTRQRRLRRRQLTGSAQTPHSA